MKNNTFSHRPALLGLLTVALGSLTALAQQPAGQAAADIESADPFRKAGTVDATPRQGLSAEMLDAQARILFSRGETEQAVALQQQAVEKAKATLAQAADNLARYEGRPVGEGPVARKLREIVIPIIDFQDTSLQEAVDFLRVRSHELDAVETNPAKKGVNFVIAPLKIAAGAEEGAGRRIDQLQLRNVSLGDVLKYIGQATGTHFEIGDHAVSILDGAAPAVATGPVAKKVREIVIPMIRFEDVSIQEAVDFLRVSSMKLDTAETDPAKKGVNIVVAPLKNLLSKEDIAAGKDGNRRIAELTLSQVSLADALKYICQATGTHFEIDDRAVNILDGPQP